MRLQTTIEFVLVLAAVSAFALSALGAYGRVHGLQMSAYADLGGSGAAPAAFANAPYSDNSYLILAELPSVLYTNSASEMQVVLSLPVGAEIASLRLNASGASLYAGTYNAIASQGVNVFYADIIANTPGPVEARASARVLFGGTARTISAVARSYAVPAAQPSQSKEMSVSISRRYEAVAYGVAAGSNIFTLRQTSRCSLVNFDGGYLPLQAQCPGAQWDFWIFSDVCYYDYGVLTRTYCIYKSNTSSRYAAALPAHAYLYNITLALLYGGAQLVANLTQESGAARLAYANGSVAGHANITNVSGASSVPYGALGVLSDEAGARIVNATRYSVYQDALDSALGTLGYYNGTGIGPAAMSSIEQSIGSYNDAARAFAASAAANQTACALRGSGGSYALACAPAAPLYYYIVANVPGVAADQSIVYEGSTVEVR